MRWTTLRQAFVLSCFSTLTVISLGISPKAYAQTSSKVHFEIAAQPLDRALRQFALQSKRQVIFDPASVPTKKAPAINGDLTPEEALKTLLEGSGLAFTLGKGDTLVITSAVPATTQSVPTEQTPPAPATGDKAGIPEILVKGSRIMNVDVKRTEDDVQPYTILDSQMIQQSGATNVEDFLKQRLTMNTLAQANSQSYPGTAPGATSSINLRGLGTNETLILIDGRRSAGVNYSVGGSGGLNQPDINGIPLAAIERIEILPSSASAIYGGAAIGGVVNIILKKSFSGGQLEAGYEDTVSAHAPLRSVSGTYGFSLADGKTRIMLSASYADAETLQLQDRLDLTQRGISTILRNSPSFFYNPSQPFSGATPNIASLDGSNLVLKNGGSLSSPITSIPAGAALGSSLSGGFLKNAGSYNLNLANGTGQYGLLSPFGTAPTRKSLMATVRQEVTPSIEGFAEFSTNSNASRTVLNPFGGSVIVPGTAPDNPFSNDVQINFPSAVSTPSTSDSVTQSMTVGLLGRLPANWQSELDYTWSKNSFEYAYDQVDFGSLSADLASGAVNPFVDTILHPLNLAPYLSPNSFSARSTLNDVGLRMSGPLGSYSWGTPTLTIGLEHRKEGSDNGDFNSVFPLVPAGNQHFVFFGQSQSTNSFYAEANVPLIGEKLALPGIRSLDLQLAGRTEHYSVFAGTPYAILGPDGSVQIGSPPQGVHKTISYTSTNPTIGLKYKPIGDVFLRASYARAFLPPTTSQLLPNPTPVFGFPALQITDPKNGQSYLVDETGGGNPNLQPQTSTAWDFGVVWEPQESQLKGLRLDVEYYKIKQPNYIASPAPQQVVSNPAYAGRVTRDPATGLITLVDLSPLNATEFQTSGWDFKLEYRRPIGIGTIDFYALATVIQHDRRQYTIDGPSLDYAGYPQAGGETKNKANGTLSWEYRNWKLGWTATYFGSYFQFGSPGDPTSLQYGVFTHYTDAQGGFSIPSQIYHDVFVNYVFDRLPPGRSDLTRNLFSDLAIQAGVKNIFNTLPPLDAAFSPYFYSSYGDPRLREYRLKVVKGF